MVDKLVKTKYFIVQFQVCATTGIAARNVGGTDANTLHAAFGLKYMEMDKFQLVSIPRISPNTI